MTEQSELPHLGAQLVLLQLQGVPGPRTQRHGLVPAPRLAHLGRDTQGSPDTELHNWTCVATRMLPSLWLNTPGTLSPLLPS